MSIKMNGIRVQTNEGETKYLAFDERSGGYPWWSSSFENISFRNSEKIIIEIKEQFRKESGEYFQKNIIPSSIEFIKVGVTEIKKINIQEKTETERYNEVIAKLSEEERKVLFSGFEKRTNHPVGKKMNGGNNGAGDA